MITLRDVNPGQVAIVRGGFGADPPRRVLITEVHADVKKGRPGISYTDLLTGKESSWAYLSQVDRVLPLPALVVSTGPEDDPEADSYHLGRGVL